MPERRDPDRAVGPLAHFLQAAGRWLGASARTSGRPPSANGASSFHLLWQVPPGLQLAEVAVTLVVPRVPTVDRLYFWALQVSFAGGAGAHLGLQWAADAPRRRRHVNWGGYAGGGELGGTASELPSSFANPNTRDYDWLEGEPHRLRIARGTDGWAGWVDDTLVRQLAAPGSTLHSPMVWSEVFADCDHPSVAVRWSDLDVVTVSGERRQVRSVVTSYQSRSTGGCDNTSSDVDVEAFVQTTATARRTPAGALLSLGGPE